MRNIAEKTHKVKTKSKTKQSTGDQEIRRINRLRVAFAEIAPGEREKVLYLLSIEIEETRDETIKHWLVVFRGVLEVLGGAK